MNNIKTKFKPKDEAYMIGRHFNSIEKVHIISIHIYQLSDTNVDIEYKIRSKTGSPENLWSENQLFKTPEELTQYLLDNQETLCQEVPF